MSRIKLPWKNFSRRVARNDLVRCVITAVNSDGSYDVRRVGVAEGVADIKRVPSVTKNDVYLVGDIASLGFVEGDPQKPFLFGFINGGAKHISVVVNPLPTPPEPELGEPAIPYVAPYPEGDPRRFIISCYSEVGCTLFGYRIGFSGPFTWVGLACFANWGWSGYTQPIFLSTSGSTGGTLYGLSIFYSKSNFDIISPQHTYIRDYFLENRDSIQSLSDSIIENLTDYDDSEEYITMVTDLYAPTNNYWSNYR